MNITSNPSSIKNPIVLVGFNGFNLYGMVRSLGIVGLKPNLVLKAGDGNFVKHSKWKKSCFFYEDYNSLARLLINKFGKSTLKPIIICCEDKVVAHLDRYYKELSNFFILSSCGQTDGKILEMMDKFKQTLLAEREGIKVPKTWHISINGEIPADIVYPCITKPYKSVKGRKEDIRICNNTAELLSEISRNDNIAQEYIDKDFEITIWGTSIGHGKYYMPGIGRKIRQWPNNFALSSYCVFESFEQHPTLDKKAIERFLTSLQYEGMFNIEMVVRGGVYYFVEINLRNGGKQYLSTRAGANLPLMYIQSRLGQDIMKPIIKLPTFLMGELTDVRQITKGKVTLGHWIKDLYHTNCFFIANMRDIKPFLYYLYWQIKSKLFSLR